MLRSVMFLSLLLAVFLAASILKVGEAPADPGGIPHVDGEIILKFKDNASQHDKDEVLAELGGSRIKGLGRIKAELRRLDSGLTVEDAVARYRNHPKIQYIEPNYILQADAVPNDPRFSQMWGLRNTGQTGGTAGADIDAVPAWDITTGSDEVLIGDIDTGADYSHPDLAANIWTNPGEIPGNGIDDDGNGFIDDVHGWDFYNDDNDPMDDNGHGTHTAGTIGALGNNGVGVTGVNWHVKIMPIKFLSSSGSGNTADAVDAINYATLMGVRLTSNSWGGGGYSQAMLDAIQAAGDAGILFVAAAGNTGSNSDLFPHYPASYPLDNIVSVAATDHNDQLAYFSTYGAVTVDLAAPGVNVLSTLPGSNYGELSGTSMACPHVAGVLGLVFARFPSIGALDAKNLILNSADPVPALAGQVLTGARLNAFFALAEPDSISPGPVNDLAVTTPGSNWLVVSWTAPGDDDGEGTASRYVVKVSTTPIDEATFDGASTASAPPDPGPAGSPQTMKVGGLDASTQYYIALKAFDEFGNASPVSNLAAGTTLGPPMASIDPTELSETLVVGTTSTQSLSLSNLAEGTLDFVIPAPNLLTSPPAIASYLDLPKGTADTRIGEPVTEGAGGPDGFGYRWVDSDEPFGPAFQWTDISTTGTPVITFADDVNVGPFPIGFAFPYYGAEYSNIRICSNGFLSFTSTSAEYVNQPLPNPAAPANMIAPFWDDLIALTAEGVYYQSDGARFIVQWDVEHYGAGGPYSFQAILYSDGAIEFQYKAMGSPSNDATVGMQNATGTDALQMAFNTAFVHDQFAVRIQSVPQWITVTPSEGTVNAGEGTTLDAAFDPSGLLGGTYHAEIHVLTNDPGSPDQTIPVSLVVIGAPDIAVTPTSYNFGDVFIGATPTTVLEIGNPGTDSLHVTSISDNPVFAASALSVVVPPHGSFPLGLTFSPTTVGTQTGVLSLASDDPDTPLLQIPLTGAGVEPPILAVSPDSVSEALFTGEMSTRVLTIHNDGASDLLLGVDIQDAPVNAPAYVPPPGPGPGPDSRTGGSQVSEPAQSPASASDPAILVIQDTAAWGLSMSAFLHDVFGLPSTVINSSSIAGTDFSPYDIVITVSDEGTAYYSAISANVGKFTDFVQSGGVVQYQMATQGDNVQIAGGVTVTFGNLESIDHVLIPGHPIVQGVPADLHGDWANHCTIANLPPGASVITETQMAHQPTTVEYALGSGRVIATGMTWEYAYPAGWDFGAMLVNATAYSLSLIGPTWLSSDIENATVPPGGSLDVTLSFDADGLLGGIYDAVVALTSNDPLRSEVPVPVHLQVTGAPDLQLSSGSLAFGDVFLTGSKNLPLTITNTGTDLLEVTGVAADDLDYTADVTAFNLAPAESLVLQVTFAPTSVQPHPAVLTLSSNDPDVPEATVSLSGTGLVPPDISVSPASLTESLYTGETSSQDLAIQNSGPSDLVLEIKTRRPAGTPPPYTPPPGANTSLSSQEAANDDPAEAQTGDTVGQFHILVIQDTAAWGLLMSAFLNQEFGLTPTVINHTQIANTDFQLYDLVITVGDESSDYYGALTANVAKFTAYAESGGIIQYQLATQGSNVQVAGGALVQFLDPESHNRVVLPGHPIVQGLPQDLSGNYANHCTIYNLPPGSQVITETSSLHRPTTVEYALGNGRVIVTGMTWEFLYEFGWPSAPLILNATAYSLNLVSPRWIRAATPEATVPPFGSMNLSMIFDAAGLPGGGYDADIAVLSNDPDESEVLIPAHLDVTDASDIDLETESLDFGTRFIGTFTDLELAVRNVGTAPLAVTDVTTDELDYLVDAQTLSVPVGAVRSIHVTFAPSRSGAIPGLLTLTTNDPDEPTVTLDLSGVGLEPPVASVTPDEIVSNLFTNDQETQTVTLENQGGSDLEFSVNVLATNGPPGPPPPPTPGPKVALHTQAHAAKSAWICRRPEDGGAAPSNIPCSQYNTASRTGVGQDVYLCVGNVTDGRGIAGLVCGISYDAASHHGADVLSWVFCGSGLEFPSDGWPASGTGNIMTWLLPNDCQSNNLPPNGSHAIAGSFYVYAYTADIFRVTEHRAVAGNPELAYVNCSGATHDIPVTSLGSIRFSTDGSAVGYNPCGPGVAVYEESVPLAKGEEDTRVGNPVTEGHGGPDVFGYQWVDSDEPSGPAFNWQDIRSVGTIVPIVGDDQTSAPIYIGFPFPFYGAAFDQFRVCTNGWISFTSSSTQYINQPLPSVSAPENLLAVFWDDLYFSGYKAYVYSDGTKLVVQFEGVYHLSGYGPYTFELILEPDGTILYQYLSMQGSVTGATVGIQNEARDDGLTVVFNGSYLHDNLAVRLSPSPTWLTVAPGFGNLPAPGSQPLELLLDATGLGTNTLLAQVQISSNDPVHGLLSVPVTLNVTGAPDLSLPEDTVDFGEVYVGYPKIGYFLVVNTGADPLSVTSIVSDRGDYVASPTSFTVIPGSNRTVEVTFTPQAAGDRSGSLSIASNDPRSPHSVQLTGIGVPPPVISVTPEIVVGTALPGGQKHKPVTVCNTGGSSLTFALSTVAPPPPPPQAGPKVALHVKTHATKAALICRRAQDGGAEPAVPCSAYVTESTTHAGRDIYMVAAGVNPNLGVAGLSCGIAYNGVPGSGVDVFAWYFCGTGLEFPSNTWPASGAGNRMTWVIPESCQNEEYPPDGVHAVAGAFYVYAYGSDSFRATENMTLQSGPELRYADCQGMVHDIPVNAVATVRFSSDGSLPGVNPCAGGSSVYPSVDLAKGQQDFRTGYPVSADQGGPDRFGYRWTDSEAPSGPAFDWVDVRGIGTAVPIQGDDETSAPIPIGFNFPYYGETFTQFRVSTNGWISLTSGSTQMTNQPLPADPAPENLLAVLWDDLAFSGQQATYLNDGNRLIVQFQDVTRDGSGPFTFEALLYPDGTIVYQYLDVQGTTTSATVGIQNGARDDGLTVAFNTPFLRPQLAVRITSPATWLSFNPSEGTVPAGECAAVDLTLDASALAAGDYTTGLTVDSNDPATPSLTREVIFHVGSIAPADFDVDPNTLNLGSSGQWVTAYVELPLEYAPADVLAPTVRLNAVVPADPDFVSLDDFNANGVPDLAFRFDRTAVEAQLDEGDSVEVRVTGEIEDTIYFTGIDYIRAIRPTLQSPNGGESLIAGTLARIEWKNPVGWAVTSATLTYSPDGGGTWSLIAENVPTDGYTWTVPAEPTTTGLVRVYVSDALGILGHDTSDEPFTVVSQVTGVEDPLPTSYALLQNAPNPFSGSSRIRFDLPQAGRVELRIYDVSGRVVRTLENGWMPAGRHESTWDGKDAGGRGVAAGVYYYRLDAEGYSARRSMSLME